MPYQLTNKEVQKTEIATYSVTGFNANYVDNKGSIRILKTDAAGNPIAYDNVGVDSLSDIIARASAIAGTDISAAVKQALYEHIETEKGLSGTIS